MMITGSVINNSKIHNIYFDNIDVHRVENINSVNFDSTTAVDMILTVGKQNINRQSAVRW